MGSDHGSGKWVPGVCGQQPPPGPHWPVMTDYHGMCPNSVEAADRAAEAPTLGPGWESSPPPAQCCASVSPFEVGNLRRSSCQVLIGVAQEVTAIHISSTRRCGLKAGPYMYPLESTITEVSSDFKVDLSIKLS